MPRAGQSAGPVWRRDTTGTPKSSGAPAPSDAFPNRRLVPTSIFGYAGTPSVNTGSTDHSPATTANRGVPVPVIPQCQGSAAGPVPGFSSGRRSLGGPIPVPILVPIPELSTARMPLHTRCRSRSRFWSRSRGVPGPSHPRWPRPGSAARRARPMGGGTAGTRRAPPRSRHPPRTGGVGGRCNSSPHPGPQRPPMSGAVSSGQ